MASELKMDGGEIAEIIEYLQRWAAGAENDAPFLIMMGRTLTPDEFVTEVEAGTPFGNAFLSYLDDQARRCQTRPLQLVYQAIVADRVR
jgi:hypothetical protein